VVVIEISIDLQRSKIFIGARLVCCMTCCRVGATLLLLLLIPNSQLSCIRYILFLLDVDVVSFHLLLSLVNLTIPLLSISAISVSVRDCSVLEKLELL